MCTSGQDKSVSGKLGNTNPKRQFYYLTCIPTKHHSAKPRFHPGHFWYGLSVPVEIFFAIFQVFWQYFKFFAIFQVFWQHFKIDSCMSINLVPCSINIKCISWYKHTYSMHKWHQIQIHRNSKHSTEWWTCSFFFNQRNSLVAFLFISIVKNYYLATT